MKTFDPINAALLLVISLVLSWYLRDRFNAIDKRHDGTDKRLDRLDHRLDGHDARFDSQDGRTDGLVQEVAALKASVLTIQGRLDELSREFAAMRSDLLQIALAVGAKTRPETA